jgi:hypothetical protein
MEQAASTLELTLLSGARSLLRRHALELPQRDDLCGAFCGALALHAAGYGEPVAGPIDQDAVAVAAGTFVSRVPDAGALPDGERSRRDYRIAPPLIDDASVSGTNCAGVLAAIESLSEGQLAALPYSGPWSGAALDALFDATTALSRPVTLIANVATRHLWGASPSAEQVLDYLLDGADAGPPSDWDVGHFVCVFGRTRGPGGALYGVADTYPSLGTRGIHVQPRDRLARALARPDMAPGGIVVALASEDAARVREQAQRAGLREGAWDNGTLSGGPAR